MFDTLSFELVFIDLWTFPIINSINAKHFMLVVDDFSLFILICFLNVKSDTQSIFENFVAVVDGNFLIS